MSERWRVKEREGGELRFFENCGKSAVTCDIRL